MNYRTALFPVISLLLINAAAPIETAPTKVYAQISGGDCALTSSISTYPVYYNSSSRRNPDSTYYQGDAFHYIIIYGMKVIGDAVCANFNTQFNIVGSINESTHSLEDEDSIRQFMDTAGDVCRNARERDLDCKYGHIEVGMDASPSEDDEEMIRMKTKKDYTHYIEFVVTADHQHCQFVNGELRCGWHKHEARDKYVVTVLRPLITIDLVKQNMTDTDGYWIRNLDQTYYLWDAINMLHIVKYRWQNERVGTLHTNITKLYDLIVETEFHCNKGGCYHTIEHNGLLPWSYSFDYSSGSTIYNATNPEFYGRHIFRYKVELFNIFRFLNSALNSTDALVVKYDPVYTNYPYNMLIDDDEWAYGNRLATALHYFGSRGGEKDDTDGIHQLRRSEINGYQYSGYAFNPVWPVALNEKLKWLGAVPVDDDSLLTDSRNSTSMFVKSGYGKILFAYPIKHFMLKTRYENATLDVTLQSVVFGGFNIKDVTELKYVYPAVKFNTRVNAAAYHSDGSVNDIPVAIEMIPQFEHGSTYLHDYLHAKVMHDTNDRKFADVVLSDTYGRGNQIAGNGFIKLKARFTSLLIPDSAELVWGDKMNIPLNLALDALSPYVIKINAGTIERTFNATLFQFYSNYHYSVNLDEDNKLNVTRHGDLLVIPFDKKFGEITMLKLNGEEHNDCLFGCSLIANKSEQLVVEAFNMWGGRAYAELQPVQSEVQSNIGITQLATTFAILLGAFILARIVARVGEKVG